MRRTMGAVDLLVDAFAPHCGEAGRCAARKLRNDTGIAALSIGVELEGP